MEGFYRLFDVMRCRWGCVRLNVKTSLRVSFTNVMQSKQNSCKNLQKNAIA